MDATNEPIAGFATTHWSVVLHAGEESSPVAHEALEKLCRTYWYPLYACVRRQGYGIEDAQDLTQAFFARLLEKGYVRLADPGRGRFRTFLLTSLKNFIAADWTRGQAAKRGGSLAFLSLDEQDSEGRYLAEPVEGLTPERLFEKRWAVTLLDEVLSRLRAEMTTEGKQDVFEALSGMVWGDQPEAGYAELAAQLGTTRENVGVMVHRLRQRFRELLRAEVAQTVATPAELEDELRHLVAVLAHPG